jgi:3-oxoacyl-[acyl-carrier-protein] synthase II
MTPSKRRVVITGAGLISPIGNSPQEAWDNLQAGRSGVRELQSLPKSHLKMHIGGEAAGFDGSIENFGELEKSLQRAIKKALRLMCREIEMGVASAQLCLQNCGLKLDSVPPERIGTMFGSDYILTMPSEYIDGVRACLDEHRQFHLENWGERGLPRVEPLWLLKYLPNMPASHVAIHNDLRGPSNSLTMREASANASIGEAVTTIRRGTADAIITGSTGTRLHPLRTVHVSLQERLATDYDTPEAACRPFDLNRSGVVLGEGAGSLMLEDLEFARSRNATILGEVVGYSSSTVANRNSVPDYRQAFKNVFEGVLANAGFKPEQVGHIHSHGLATIECDRCEAAAITDVFGLRKTPVTAAKSYMGNLGAGSGLVETITSLWALANNRLFPILNYRTPDPECPILAADPDRHGPGDSFINVNITPQGQASAILVRKFQDR